MSLVIDTITILGFTIAFIILMNKYVLNKNVINKIQQFKDKNSTLTYTLFTIIGTILAIIGSPTSPINIIAYYLFKPLIGFLMSLVVHITGAIISYLIIKKIKLDFIVDKLKKIKMFDTFYNLNVSDNKWLELSTLFRVAPTFPYALVSYFLSLTKIPLVIYIISTVLGSIPYMASEIYMIHNSKQLVHSTKSKWTYIIPLVLTVASVIIIDKVVKNTLQKEHKKLQNKQ